MAPTPITRHPAPRPARSLRPPRAFASPCADGSQGGAECLYQINLKDLAITKTYALPAGADDAHGIAFCKAASTGKYYLLNTNRASATLDVLDYETGAVVVDSFDLNSPFEKKVLQPDVIFYRNGTLYMAARGPEPVSAVKAQNFFEDATTRVAQDAGDREYDARHR